MNGGGISTLEKTTRRIKKVQNYEKSAGAIKHKRSTKRAGVGKKQTSPRRRQTKKKNIQFLTVERRTKNRWGFFRREPRQHKKGATRKRKPTLRKKDKLWGGRPRPRRGEKNYMKAVEAQTLEKTKRGGVSPGLGKKQESRKFRKALKG